MVAPYLPYAVTEKEIIVETIRHASMDPNACKNSIKLLDLIKKVPETASFDDMIIRYEYFAGKYMISLITEKNIENPRYKPAVQAYNAAKATYDVQLAEFNKANKEWNDKLKKWEEENQEYLLNEQMKVLQKDMDNIKAKLDKYKK